MADPVARWSGKGTAPLTDARKGAITDGLTKAASMIGVGHEVFKGLVRVAQPGRPSEGAQTPRRQQPRIPAPSRQQPPSAPQAPQQPHVDPETGFRGGNGGNGTAQRQPNAGTGFRNDDGMNGTGQRQTDPGTRFRDGSSNGAARAQADVGTGFRGSGGNGTSTATPTVQASPTIYWLKANDHADKLDRAQVSALARQVIDGTLSWLEAQSRLDDWIDAATLPAFGAANGATLKVPVAAVTHMTERTSDPLDELFE